MENLAQLRQDAEDCRHWASALRDEIDGGGNINNCTKLSDALSRKAGKLNRVFCALSAATEKERN